MLIDLENEGPRPDKAVPCMIMTMRQGKTNQHGKVEYMGCMRNIDPILCPLSAMAFYFFYRWGRDGAEKFPSFRQPEDYYNLHALPGSVKVPGRPLSYHTQADWERRMFEAVGIHKKEKTYSQRKQAARHAELNGVPETQIRRAGRWNTDALCGAYLSYLPRAFMRSIAGFPQEGKGYFLPRAQETPEEALCSRIWPEADSWLRRMEAYHPGRDDNEVVRLDLAGTGFLRLIRTLRVILLQDSVILRKRFPLHPLWKDSLFHCPEYLRFAARVESSLADVVTPAELTMQQLLPAQEAVAKLRHEAMILGFQGLESRMGEFSERLGQMERSAAAFAAPPIWIQQGSTGTGIWIGGGGPAGGGFAHAHLPQPHLPRPQLLPPPPPPPPLPPPPPPPATAAPSTPAPIPASTPTSTPVSTPASGPASALASTAASALATASTPTFALASIPTSALASTPTSALASTPASALASAPPAQGPFVLDPWAPPRPYKMLRGSNSVFQLWVEWTLGLLGGPSIEALDRCWGARWRVGGEAMFYSRRNKVIVEIRRRVSNGMARDERQAIDQLEQLRGSHSMDWLCKNITPSAVV